MLLGCSYQKNILGGGDYEKGRQVLLKNYLWEYIISTAK